MQNYHLTPKFGLIASAIVAVIASVIARISAPAEPTLEELTTVVTSSPYYEEYSVVLPRLALAYYFWMALVAFLVLLFLQKIVHNHVTEHRLLSWLMLVPAAWLVATLAVTGISTATYNMTRDFIFIAIATIPIFAALRFGLQLYRARPSN